MITAFEMMVASWGTSKGEPSGQRGGPSEPNMEGQLNGSRDREPGLETGAPGFEYGLSHFLAV